MQPETALHWAAKCNDLTGRSAIPYTPTVRRLTAMLVGLTCLSTWVHVSALHVHVYAGHDHADHHHGPAAHAHPPPSPPQPAGAATRLEVCDPGRHAISFAILCTAPPHAPAADAGIVTRAAADVDLVRRQTVAVLDTRTHSPPQKGQASSRAPPRTFRV